MDVFSKIAAFHQAQGYQFIEIEGLKLPTRYAKGVDQEILLMQTTAGVMDLIPFHAISAKGPEAAIFLQGMVSNDIHQIQIGQIQPNLLSNHKGKILYRVDIARVSPEEYLLLTNAGEGLYVGGYLDHFHIREDLEMSLLTPESLRCDVIGPASANALKAGGYSDTLTWSFQSEKITTLFSRVGQLARYVNIVPQTCYLDFLEALLKTSEKIGMAGFEALDQIRIDAGIPRVGVDYTRENFPQEAALMDHISYEKGCYIGQETHARMYHRGHPNWQSVGIKVPSHLRLQPGQKLFYNEEEVGTITSLSQIVHEDIQRGIAFIKYAQVQANTLFASEAGGENNIQQVSLASNVMA